MSPRRSRLVSFHMALGMVRPEDGTGAALLGTLNQVDRFADQKFSAKVQKDMIMDFFGQVGMEIDHSEQQ